MEYFLLTPQLLVAFTGDRAISKAKSRFDIYISIALLAIGAPLSNDVHYLMAIPAESTTSCSLEMFRIDFPLPEMVLTTPYTMQTRRSVFPKHLSPSFILPPPQI